MAGCSDVCALGWCARVVVVVLLCTLQQQQLLLLLLLQSPSIMCTYMNLQRMLFCIFQMR